MQRARRWRRVVKWGLLAGAAGVVIWTVASCWWWVGWSFDDGQTARSVEVGDGSIVVWRMPGNSIPAPFRGLAVSAPRRNPSFSILGMLRPTTIQMGPTSITEIPLWIPFALTLGPYLLLARADAIAAKRAKVGMCPACGYDRAGLAVGVVCPECGKVAATGGAA